MANNNRYRGKENSNYGNREEDRERYGRKDYNQYGNDYENESDRRSRRYDEDKDDYNNRMSNYGYGSQGKYDNTGAGAYGYGTEYNRSRGYDEDYNEDYGTQSYGYGRRYDRDREYTNNFNRNRDWWDKTKDEVSSWFGDNDAERRRRMDRKMGAHRGRGPKGYTRSDERIREDINDRLSDDSFLDASDIEVTVSNGEATLTGTVDNRIDKRRAEDLAEDISGVKNVQNQLRVKQSASANINGLKNEYQG